MNIKNLFQTLKQKLLNFSFIKKSREVNTFVRNGNEVGYENPSSQNPRPKINRYIIGIVSVFIIIFIGTIIKLKFFPPPSQNTKDDDATKNLTPGVTTTNESQVRSLDEQTPKRSENPEPFILAPVSKDVAQQEKAKVASKLPIYITDFKTSSDINIVINIYNDPYEPPETLRFDIYGIDYYSSSASEDNPYFVAFKEGYLKGIEELKARGIDPMKLFFLFGQRDYIRETGKAWAEEINKSLK